MAASSRNQTRHPRARTSRLLIERLEEEVLVYDLRHHRAHCLNAAAARLWDCCDGTRSVRDLVLTYENDLPQAEAETAVSLGLRQLGRARLLEQPVASEAVSGSRRDLLRRLGQVAAISIPLVASITSPAPAATASESCVASNACRPVLDLCRPCGPGCTKRCDPAGQCSNNPAGC